MHLFISTVGFSLGRPYNPVSYGPYTRQPPTTTFPSTQFGVQLTALHSARPIILAPGNSGSRVSVVPSVFFSTCSPTFSQVVCNFQMRLELFRSIWMFGPVPARSDAFGSSWTSWEVLEVSSFACIFYNQLKQLIMIRSKVRFRVGYIL